MTISILAVRPGPEERIFTGSTYSEIEREADAWGALRFEDALGGVFRKLYGEWVFLYQKHSKKD